MIILPKKNVKIVLKEFYERVPAEEIRACEDVNILWAKMTTEEQNELLNIFFAKVSKDLPWSIMNAIVTNV